MLLLLLPLLGHALDARPLARVDEPLRKQTWWRLDMEPAPARPVWRNRKGTWTCWTWPDGVAERCVQREGRQDRQVLTFDAGGRLLATVTLDASGPARVTVQGLQPTEIDVSAWVEQQVGGLVLKLPAGASQRGDMWVATPPGGTLTVQRVSLPAGTALIGDTTTLALRQSCGCVVEDRTTAWIGDRAAVRHRVVHPHPTAPATGEVWVVPDGDAAVVIGYAHDGQADRNAVDASLALARAVIALAHWETP